MGTIIDALHVVHGNWRNRHSALHLAVAAAKGCLLRGGVAAADLDLLVNAGVYRDRNLGEPALAAMIQEDIGAHPEDPHSDTHGTFSFDISNGTCGILTALQIADGFLRSRTVSRVIVVTSDADPGRGTTESFPYSPAGAALLCSWSDDERGGLGRVHWLSAPDEADEFRATVGFEHSRNVLRVQQPAAMDTELAAAATRVARRCLDEASLGPDDAELIAAAPPHQRYRIELAKGLGVGVDRIAVAADDRMHTASLVAALPTDFEKLPAGAPVLLTAATGGIVAGAALYRMPAG
jgi:3-oxoacyl-[acyl-carrier-protein] synthase-3